LNIDFIEYCGLRKPSAYFYYFKFIPELNKKIPSLSFFEPNPVFLEYSIFIFFITNNIYARPFLKYLRRAKNGADDNQRFDSYFSNIRAQSQLFCE